MWVLNDSLSFQARKGLLKVNTQGWLLILYNRIHFSMVQTCKYYEVFLISLLYLIVCGLVFPLPS